jgi:thymidylate synthase (FAD)
MSASIISYSKPNVSDDSITLQDMIVYCARVSNPGNQSNTDGGEKLIRYLIDNNHWSPFEMVSICIEIQSTRDICRQILRHRSFSFQEFSQRYAVADLGMELRDARLQDKKNRQNSIEIEEYGEFAMESSLKEQWLEKQVEIAELSKTTYHWALSNGIAKEQARSVLPEGMTLSRMYMNGTLRSWIHYIQLRSGNGTQKEHREVAIACANEIAKIFPMILDLVN